MTSVRNGLAAVLATGMLALVMASAPAVAAAETEPLRGEMTISVVFPECPDCHWAGTISGDIVGTIELWEIWDKIFVVGSTEHYFETFKITTSTGVISGVDQGLWNFATFKFRANGWVTEATGDWAYLVGYKVHEMGTTSAPPPAGPPLVTGTASWFLAEP